MEETDEGERDVPCFSDTELNPSGNADSSRPFDFVFENATERCKACLTRRARFSFPFYDRESLPSCLLETRQFDLALNVSMRAPNVLSHGFMIYFGRMSPENFDGGDGIRRLVVDGGKLR